jgi:hypothetical protein
MPAIPMPVRISGLCLEANIRTSFTTFANADLPMINHSPFSVGQK